MSTDKQKGYAEGWEEGHSRGYRDGYDAGDANGYARAKAEMLSKLDTFNPVYVEGGRVPEDAIEHRNQPRGKE